MLTESALSRGAAPRMRAASDYALRHLAVHLHDAGQMDRLYELLVASRDWMDVKYERTASHAGYVADLQVARRTLRDPLDAQSLCRLLELHAARLVVGETGPLVSPSDLETLVLLGREVEALEAVRLRSDAYERAEGLAAVERLLRGVNRPMLALLDELERGLPEIREGWQRGSVARGLATALREVGYLEEARRLAFSIADGPSRGRAMIDLLETEAGPDGADEAALEALLAAARARDDAYELAYGLGQAAAVCQRLGDAARAAALFAEAREAIAAIERRDRWNWAARDYTIHLAEAGLFNDAIASLEALTEPLQIDQTREGIARRMSARGREEDALELVRGITDLEDRAQALVRLAMRRVEVGEPDAAHELLAEAARWAERIPAKKARWVPWTDLAVGWERAGDAAAADRCLARAWSLSTKEKSDHDRSHASSMSLRAYLAVGRFEEARHRLDLVADEESRQHLLGSLALHLARAGELAKAEEALAEAREVAAARLDDYAAAEVSRAVAGALLESGCLDPALGVIRLIRRELDRDRALRQAAMSYQAAGREHKALEMIGEIGSDTERDEALAELVRALGADGKLPRALELAKTIRDPKRRAESLLAAVDGLAKEGRFAEAVRLAEKFQKDDRFTNPVGRVAVEMVRQGDVEGALRVVGGLGKKRKASWALRESAEVLARRGRVDEALALARSIPKKDVRQFGFESIAKALVETGDVELGLARAAELPTAKRASLTVDAVRAWIDRGELERAISAAAGIPAGVSAGSGHGTRYLDLAARALAEALAKAGRHDEAIGWATRIEDERWRHRTLAMITDGLAAAGRNAEAESLRAEVEIHPYDAARRVTERVQELAQTGEIEVALERAEEIPDKRDRGYAQLDVLRVLLDQGRWDEARWLAERVASREETGKAFLILVTALVEQRSYEEALRHNADNPGFHERREGTQRIAAALAAEGRFEAAVTACGLMPLREFLSTVCGWSESMEPFQPGTFWKALERLMTVAGWASPDWKRIAEALGQK